MQKFRAIFLTILGAKASIALLIIFCSLSFLFGQYLNDMNLFASSGAMVLAFGLIHTIKYTTLKKLANREVEISSRSGVTGPPLSVEESKKMREENLIRARIEVREEIKSEMLGVFLTIFGTFLWAYGGYIRIITPLVDWMQKLI
ncbi:hypothetical protein [Xenorhabdus ishibashii]|uniref:Uncharacterized protein n=1 Tax=Xenorhabdus ishibashii TaxID=1034471 RepID=A0A2D0KCC4_9GAMM|nr:hypothetical protein [Xenorhabdus ishibashii]PHM61022.1 hypothetical protein Xish_00131 [Xenorhabdus ishibashii]